jgi:hypothetical protein
VTSTPYGIGAVDDAVQVDVDDRSRHPVGLLEHRTERHDAGVVDQDVDGTDRRDRGQEGAPRLGIGDVERGGHDLAAVRPRDHLCQVGVTVTDGNPGALPGEPFDGGLADAPRAAGDDDGESGKVTGCAHAGILALWSESGVRSTGRPSFGKGSDV